MRKHLLIFVILMIAFFCACGANEIPETQKEPVISEKVTVTVDGKDYEVFVPAKTRFEISEGAQMYVYTPSLSEGATVDLSGLSGCGYIEGLSVTLSGENESLVLPKLPNLDFCEVFGNDIALIDASAIEGCKTLSLSEVLPKEIKIGKGPESLILGYGFDLGKIGPAENVRNITIHGDADLSKIADIGPVEKVYIFGENTNIAGLENLKSLKRLSFQAFSGDLSAAGNLSMEILVFNSDITQEILDTLTKSETVTELHLNDEFLTNADFIGKLLNLNVIVLTVDPIQPPEVPIRDEITDVSQIELLETNLPKEPLKAFFEKGGTILIMDDWSRTKN